MLYFGSLLFVVHYRARLDGIRTLEAEQLGDWRAALKARWHLLVPLFWLATLIVSGLAVADAAVQASVLTIVLGTLRRTTRKAPLEVVQALVRTSERALSVAIPCAIASVIVAVIAFTGLGTKFTGLVVHLSSGSLALALVFTALGSQAGVTGLRAFYLALPPLVIPFAFVVHPALVTWSSATTFAWALVQVIAACWAFSVLVPGWLGRPLGVAERILFASGGIACFLPQPGVSAAGFALLAILAVVAYRGRQRRTLGHGSTRAERTDA